MLVSVAVAMDTRAVGQAAAIVAGDLSSLWVYLTAPFVRAVLAVLLYRRLGTA
jgi:glycerol uptake facilitator-like aquaporin